MTHVHAVMEPVLAQKENYAAILYIVLAPSADRVIKEHFYLFNVMNKFMKNKDTLNFQITLQEDALHKDATHLCIAQEDWLSHRLSGQKISGASKVKKTFDCNITWGELKRAFEYGKKLEKEKNNRNSLVAATSTSIKKAKKKSV